MSLSSSSASESGNLSVKLRLGDAALGGTSEEISRAVKWAETKVSTNVGVSASTSTIPLPSSSCSVGYILAIAVLYCSSVGTALQSSGNTAVAVSLGRVAIENVKTLALRLGQNLAGDNCVDQGGVYDGLFNHGHVLLCHIIEYLRGSIDNSADSAVSSASGAIAAIVSSENVASAAESIRVEGAHWGGRDNDVEQAAFAVLEGSSGAGHTAAV